MALSTIVKVGSIRNLSDARYCAGMMVDVLGFSINPNDKNYIKEEETQDIYPYNENK